MGFARSFTAAPRATRIGRLVSEAVPAKISSILRIESNRFAKILKIRILESNREGPTNGSVDSPPC